MAPFRMTVGGFLVAAVGAMASCDTKEASCDAPARAQGLLQRHKFSAGKAMTTPLSDKDEKAQGAPDPVRTHDAIVEDSVHFAQEILREETKNCGASLAVESVAGLSAQLEIEDGVRASMSTSIVGASGVVYHRLDVLWQAGDHEPSEFAQSGYESSLSPSLLLPQENGMQIAWCTVLARSTSVHLSQLAEREGHEAVHTYHKMLGYLGDSEGKNPDPLVQVKTAQCAGSDNLPAEYNLRFSSEHANCFTAEAVNDQGSCGSCWAFAAAQSVTARLCMQDQADITNNSDGGGRRSVSVQTVLSCSSSEKGCGGGFMSHAFAEWQRGGAPLASDYPYSPGDGGFPWHSQEASCEWGLHLKPYRVSSHYSVPASNARAMQEELFCNGPFSVAFKVYDNFFSLSTGIYTATGGDVAGGHAANLIGYGTSGGTDYWELMNSWGSSWGDNGYFKFQRGTNLCRIESWGLLAAHVEKTAASWVYDEWGTCAEHIATECADTDNGAADPWGDDCAAYTTHPNWCGGYDGPNFFSGTMCCVCGGGEQRPLEGGGASRKKERGIKCVSNAGISAAMSESSCPVSDGWPLPSTFPSSGASAAAEKGAIRNCTDGPEECTDALCNGHGDATGAAGACACSCHPGYEGDLCQQCAAGFEGYPQCRESCTRVDDCTGHGDASGVKWQNDFGAMLDSCSCTCDLGYHGLHCEGADTTTTTTSTTFLAAGPGAVNLGNAGTYAILSKAGISTVPTSTITGNIGVSPIAATAITGFSLTADSANGFATSTQVAGFVYAADYATPTPSDLTVAIGDMEVAYTDAAGRPTPDHVELFGGLLGGKTLGPGLYKFSTSVKIPTDLIISGSRTDTWIFQMSGDLVLAANKRVTLVGGALASNIVWQVAGYVQVGVGAHMEGILLI
ncbi:unnamed protein product [Polarella glacialis]|uniref:Peptidase C1A papain C-terminal domain-containing protein n=1 Tax=Polarella glacialis TaxID=89957 RepID=A0A813IQ67_POLGL|nr:unnamed protein product [Polarella glacialis]